MTTTIKSSTHADRFDPIASTGPRFDVHNLVAVDVDPGTPGAPQLLDMLEPFVGESSAPARIRVTGEMGAMVQPSRAEDTYRYTDRSLLLPRDRVTVTCTEDGFTVAGRGELLTAVIPLLDRLCVMQGAAMVHAAVVSLDGRGVFMPAWGGVGKTSTVAKLLAQDRSAFLADDWAFLRADGTLLAYAKPMFLKPHHRTIYPQAFTGIRKPLAPGRLTHSLEHLATAVHPVIVRYPRTAAFTRRWSPEHTMVRPADVFGPTRLADAAPLQVAVFLERFDGTEAILDARTTEWMTSRVVGNFHSELPGVSRDLITALGATGLVTAAEHFGQKAAVVARALAGVPCYRLRIPAAWSADRASDHVAATVTQLVERPASRRGRDDRP